MSDWWPLFGIKVSSPPLVLRPVRDDDIPGLIEAIDAGIHDPDVMPFAVPWTEQPSPQRERGTAQHMWKARAEWTAESWHLTFGVFLDEMPIGVQGLSGKDFGVLKTVSSGSWLTKPQQGKGYGKLMRQMMLHFAFEGLGADYAESEAWSENAASIGVSSSVGYERNGSARRLVKGKAVDSIHFRISRAQWEKTPRPSVEIEGLETCREMFG